MASSCIEAAGPGGVDVAVHARGGAQPQLDGTAADEGDLERHLAGVVLLDRAEHDPEPAGGLGVEAVVPRHPPSAADPAAEHGTGLAPHLGARARGAAAQRRGELAVGAALVVGGCRDSGGGRVAAAAAARAPRRPATRCGAQRRTKRAAAAKVGNSHVRPALNCRPAPPRSSTRGPGGSRRPTPTLPPALAAVGERDRGRAVGPALDEQRVAAPEAHHQQPAAEPLALRARVHEARRSPAARASPGLQIPPATRQIPWRSARRDLDRERRR